MKKIKLTALETHRMWRGYEEIKYVLSRVKGKNLTAGQVLDMKLLERAVECIELFSLEIEAKRE